MPRKSKKQQAAQPEAAKSFDEFVDETEVVDDDVASAEAAATAAAEKMRDWRDVEKLKEERMLRRLIDDDLDIDDLPSSPGARARRR